MINDDDDSDDDYEHNSQIFFTNNTALDAPNLLGAAIPNVKYRPRYIFCGYSRSDILRNDISVQ